MVNKKAFESLDINELRFLASGLEHEKLRQQKRTDTHPVCITENIGVIDDMLEALQLELDHIYHSQASTGRN